MNRHFKQQTESTKVEKEKLIREFTDAGDIVEIWKAERTYLQKQCEELLKTRE